MVEVCQDSFLKFLIESMLVSMRKVCHQSVGQCIYELTGFYFCVPVGNYLSQVCREARKWTTIKINTETDVKEYCI